MTNPSFRRIVATATAGCLLLQAVPAFATVPLADQPVFTNMGVPGNLALALSVEFPTAISVAHISNTYEPARTQPYLGYFDPAKCYRYVRNASDESRSHFAPAGAATNRLCTGSGQWSGNFLNWATMQTIDPFRWVLTGGYRSIDETGITLLEKAWHSGQGSGNFPNRSLGSSTLVQGATPFGWGSLNMRVQGLGNRLRFTASGSIDTSTPTAYSSSVADSVDGSTTYEVFVRVRVCDADPATGPLETNCTQYPNGGSPIWKPTGLIHKYADKIRFSAFGYLNDSDIRRDGAVLRARQKFVGPSFQLPGAAAATNPVAEWSADTGIFVINPDAADASATASAFSVTVGNSGVVNYLNKFGLSGSYKTHDPVGELYYAALRYYRALGNVPEWTAMGSADATTRARYVDQFPVITNWNDPILYACQRNFVLGIGDVNTHADKNVAGSPTGTGNEPTKPASVVADTGMNAVTATNKVGQLHGNGLGSSLGSAENIGGCCNNNSALMAGLAYHANTLDIRPDDATKPQTKGKQTVQTYWMDVLEYQTYKSNNQFYLTAKYGGFAVPEGFDPWTRSTDIPLGWWSTNGETVGGQNRPDNYFVASDPASVVNGLTRAFADIASKLRPFTTSFSTTLPQVSSTNTATYSARYDASTWTGEVSASSASFDPLTNTPTQVEAWSFSQRLRTQASGTGWNTGRVIATFNDQTRAGVPFRLANLSAAQAAALDTAYRSGNDAGDFLNYLRGDVTHEQGSTVAGGARAYRTRDGILGDIVGSKARPIGPPQALWSSSSNPGYAEFKAARASRPTVVYVGSNGGMLHAINGALTGTGAGNELFAYVPGVLYAGPTGTPAATGLQSRGNPDFTHRYFVDSSPVVFDLDFGRTVGGSGTDWRSVLVGGLGKGGRAYYALDVTDPAAMTSESAVASRVLWEFTDPDLGYTYGEPIAMKTRKHGWVIVFASGYNNADGRGYFFFVNPRTGALLEKVSTGAGTASAQAGLAHVQSYMPDRTDGTAESLYAGDLQGRLWRLDVSAASGSYPAPVQIAQLADAQNNALPVTSRPLVVIQPNTNRRWVTVGTGRLLASSDIASTQPQAFFAIMDGTATAFNTAAKLPSGVSFPIGNGRLRQLTDLTQPVVLNLATEMGWWVDLGAAGGGGPGWRVLSDPTSFYGAVTFAAMLPSADACNPSGQNRVYSIDLGSGQSTLTTGAAPVNGVGPPRVAYYDSVPGVVTDYRTYSVGRKPVLLVCGDTGVCTAPPQAQPGTLGLRRLNWRELILAD